MPRRWHELTLSSYGASVQHARAIETAFTSQRKRLWALCYRMSGCAADADDLVQASFERALSHPPDDLARDLAPWFTRVTINACRDHLRRRKQRGYTGPWLPGPLETRELQDVLVDADTPEARYGQLESVSLAFLCALEALTPNQRAVLVLRDVLDLSVQETAEALDVRAPVVKTTLHRARAALSSYDAGRVALTPERQQAMQSALEAFMVHLAARNTDALRLLLTEDVIAVNDAAGEYVAAKRLVHGRDKVLLFCRKTMRPARGFHACTLNGTPAMLADLVDGQARWPRRVAVWIELDALGRITRVNTAMAAAQDLSLAVGASASGSAAFGLAHAALCDAYARAGELAARACRACRARRTRAPAPARRDACGDERRDACGHACGDAYRDARHELLRNAQALEAALTRGKRTTNAAPPKLEGSQPSVPPCSSTI